MFGHDLKPYEMFGYPFFFGVLAVIVANTFPSDFMTAFLYAFEVNVAFVPVFYLYQESCKYVDGQTSSAPKAQSAPRPPLQNLNEQYNQTVAGVRFDARKNFANIVYSRLEYGYTKVNLTEDYWIKKHHWQGTPEEFRQMMHDWDGDVVERKNPKNPKSSYFIRSKDRLLDKAEGRR
jgi:hypothetical protein